MNRVFLLDDDVFFNQTLSKLLLKNGYEVEPFYQSKLFFEFFYANEKPDLIITDYRLPESNGLEIIQKLKKINPNIPVILITNYSDIKMAVKSIKLGAFEFVSKPIIPDEFLKVIQQALKTHAIDRTSESLSTDFIKGTSIDQIWSQVDAVAPTDLSVLITGESGTGKEQVARYIHHQSKRKNLKFVAVDCGALPEETILSELFGHEKGAFTGAIQKKIGQFEYAKGGSIFLDEIGNLSHNSQIKLLRSLQERKIRPLGSNTDIDIDVRIIAATNEKLEQSIEDKSFRLDLFYRLNEFPIALPPLRKRIQDLEGFIDFFGQKAAAQLDRVFEGIDDNLREAFQKHSWPGNLRELRNFIQRGVLLSQSGLITEKDLAGFQVDPIISKEASKITTQKNLKANNKIFEAELIQSCLRRHKHNKSKTAEELGITRATLYKKIEQYGIE